MRHNREMRERIESVLVESLIEKSEYEIVFVDDTTCILMLSADIVEDSILVVIDDLEEIGFEVVNNFDDTITIKS